MAFQLSQRSLGKLEGVNPKLVAVVKRAIEITTVDFGVTEGLRTKERQIELFEKGASQIREGGTHVEGRAVDLMAYIDDRGSWELNLYDNIADAMKQAAIEQGVAIRWGAAWNVPDIRSWSGTMEEAMNYYIDTRRKQGQRPFIDGPHFELVGQQ
jgi:peptidoglycan L-alanyl-D-glutamate endopeptidase CwlK